MIEPEEYASITPFDVEGGILFKHGRVYLDRANQIHEFQSAIQYQVPRDFLEMIGDWCEGGFDGHYRVLLLDDTEFQWHYLLPMHVADARCEPEHDVLNVIRSQPELFGTVGALRFFPFGKAAAFRPPDTLDEGFLVFAPLENDAVYFVSQNRQHAVRIAHTFRQMMHRSSYVFYG